MGTLGACNAFDLSFQVRDLVWKTVLPLKTDDGGYARWSPRLEDFYNASGFSYYFGIVIFSKIHYFSKV